MTRTHVTSLADQAGSSRLSYRSYLLLAGLAGGPPETGRCFQMVIDGALSIGENPDMCQGVTGFIPEQRVRVLWYGVSAPNVEHHEHLTLPSTIP